MSRPLPCDNPRTLIVEHCAGRCGETQAHYKGDPLKVGGKPWKQEGERWYCFECWRALQQMRARRGVA